MVLTACMAYCVVPPYALRDNDKYVMICEGTTDCSNIIASVTKPPYTRTNTKVVDEDTGEYRSFTDKASKYVNCVASNLTILI